VSQTQITPLEDRLVVMPVKETEEMKGSLYIPIQAQEQSQKGDVIAVGPGKVTDHGVLIPMTIGVGDMVIYGKYAGSTLSLDGEEVLVIRESDVIALVT